jgi:hypothetical protein
MLLAAAGFALVSAPAPVAARQPGKDDIPKPPANYREVSAFKTAQGIPKGELNKAKEAFAAFAKYYAEYVSHPKVYTTPQEFRGELPGSPGVPQTLDYFITEINRHILVPLPGSSVSADNNADYIRELGAALDAALKDVIEKHGDRIVRINATRLLAAACRSGATAHYPTVTSLLTNANTPPEVKYYLFQAAGNLLAAYDMNDYRSRKHSNGPKEVSDLIAALQAAVTKPEAILPQPAAGGNNQLQTIPPDQIEVLRFIRRQAVHALGQVRFAEQVPGGPALYPAFTLARVAVSDPALAAPPTPAEIADAITGICHMSCPRGPGVADQYGYAMADVLTTGVATFAVPRAASSGDKSLPWKGTAARLSDSLKAWRAAFDANYDPARPTVVDASTVPKVVTDVIAEIDRRVLLPMAGTDGKIDINGLLGYRNNTIRRNKAWGLAPFKDKPALVLPKKD